MSKTEELTKQEKASITKFQDFQTVEEQLNYAQWLIDSKLINFRKPEEAIMAFNMGRAIGLDPAVAAVNLYVVNGKITFSVHLAAALAKQAGVDWQLIKDCEEVRDESGNQVAPFLVTEIRFLRYNEKLRQTVENHFSYTWTDATNAGYTTKDNWQRLPKNMMRARCLIEGIRFVAPDVLAGIFYEATEIADNTQNLNVETVLDEDGNPVIVANT